MSRSLSEDIELLKDYAQFRAINKGKDVSPEAFLVQRGQEAAYQKLEEIIAWFSKWVTGLRGYDEQLDEALDELGAILN